MQAQLYRHFYAASFMRRPSSPEMPPIFRAIARLQSGRRYERLDAMTIDTQMLAISAIIALRLSTASGI